MVSFDEFRLLGIEHRIFALSLPVRPSSVRDSMFRAQEFCAGLKNREILKRETKALVVGMGPTGMTVAAALLRHGAARVTVCDYPLPDDTARMSGCVTRVLCPTTTDFPASHWTDRRFPHTVDVKAELPWKSARARDVHNVLRRGLQLRVAEHEIGRYEYLEDARWSHSAAVSSDVLRVTIDQEGTTIHRDVELIIICTGPGRQVERLHPEDGNFVGFGFWTNNDKMMVSPEAAAGKRVLIVGGGDGGIGDFVRLLTGNIDPAESIKALALPEKLLNILKPLSRDMWSSFNSGDTRKDHDNLMTVQEQLL